MKLSHEHLKTTMTNILTINDNEETLTNKMKRETLTPDKEFYLPQLMKKHFLIFDKRRSTKKDPVFERTTRLTKKEPYYKIRVVPKR